MDPGIANDCKLTVMLKKTIKKSGKYELYKR